jgi:hypothetical protein
VGDQYTVAEGPAPETVLPAPDTDQTYPVAFEAEVVKVVEAVPWQIVPAEGVGTEGVPTLAGTITVPVAQAVVLHVPDART